MDHSSAPYLKKQFKMEMMYELLLISHVVLAIAALLFGTLAIISKKGSTFHIICGKGFYYTMISNLPLAMIICVMPSHTNIFLFSVGVFSFYFTLTAFRAFNERTERSARIDRYLGVSILTTGILMIILPLFTTGFNIILLFFGGASIHFGVMDIKRSRLVKLSKSDKLKEHITKFMAAYISAVTAFIVNVVSAYWFFWILPGVLGGYLIGYYVKKFTNPRSTNVSKIISVSTNR